MVKPAIYISFGMAKSGSTLAFELTKAVLESAGLPQPRLSDEAVEARHGINFAETIRPVRLKAMVAEARALDTTIVVKTHHPPWDCSLRALDSGDFAGSAVCRDPRDLVLSLLDAGRKARAGGGRGFRDIDGVEAALKMVRFHVRCFQKWAIHPAMTPLDYESVAFDSHGVAARIAEQIGIEADIDWAVAQAHGGRFTQFNKGASARHRSEMDPAQSAAIQEEFADFIARYCPEPAGDPQALPADSREDGLVGKIRDRLFRR